MLTPRTGEEVTAMEAGAGWLLGLGQLLLASLLLLLTLLLRPARP